MNIKTGNNIWDNYFSMLFNRQYWNLMPERGGKKACWATYICWLYTQVYLSDCSLATEHSGNSELERQNLEFRAAVCDVRLLASRVLFRKGAPNIDFRDPFYFWLNNKLYICKAVFRESWQRPVTGKQEPKRRV